MTKLQLLALGYMVRKCYVCIPVSYSRQACGGGSCPARVERRATYTMSAAEQCSVELPTGLGIRS